LESKRSETPSLNLLHIPLFRALFKSHLYPGVLQVVTGLVFAFIIVQLLVGPAIAHDNFGTAMT
jgi:hypothetical protein